MNVYLLVFVGSTSFKMSFLQLSWLVHSLLRKIYFGISFTSWWLCIIYTEKNCKLKCYQIFTLFSNTRLVWYKLMRVCSLTLMYQQYCSSFVYITMEVRLQHFWSSNKLKKRRDSADSSYSKSDRKSFKGFGNETNNVSQ